VVIIPEGFQFRTVEAESSERSGPFFATWAVVFPSPSKEKNYCHSKRAFVNIFSS
jgi:hypothetical protein